MSVAVNCQQDTPVLEATCVDFWDCATDQMADHPPYMLDKDTEEVLCAEDEMLEDWDCSMVMCFNRERVQDILLSCEESLRVRHDEICTYSEDELEPVKWLEQWFVRSEAEMIASEVDPMPIVIECEDGVDCVVEGYDR